MPQIFLCYAKEDEAQVEEIYGRLQALGFQPWMAKIDGTPGQLGKDEIRRAVQAAEFFLIFLSNNSVAQQGYLQREYQLALDVLEEIPDTAIYILAVRFDNCAIPMPLRRLRYGWSTIYEVHDFEGIENHIRGHLQPGPQCHSAGPSQPLNDEEGVPLKLALHDQVYFSVTSPSLVFPGLPFLIDVWAHFWNDKNDILTQVREATGNAEIRIKSKGPVRIAQGIVLTVRLALDGLTVQEAEDTLLWAGTLSNATFSVMVPSEAEPGTRRGRATVYNESFEIARVHFLVRVGSTAQKNEATNVNFIPAKQHRKAFASYAHADRDAVLARLQGILKIIPCLDIFMDVLSLRSGQNWEQELEKIIPLHDVFYLFWSRNAKGSVWVEREWRYALASRGLDFIDPVPLDSPDEVPPPPELGSLHFNDWVLAFMRGKTDSLLQ
jgi:hypothetical protein